MRDFNFFSIYVDTKKNSQRKVLRAVLSTLALVVIFGSVFSFYQFKIISLNTQLEKLEAEITSKERIDGVNKYKETKKKLEILNQYYAAIDGINLQLSEISNIKTSLLRDIAETFPEEVYITIMAATSSEVQMQGTSKSRVAIAEFQHNLKNIEEFKDVYVSILNKESGISNNYIFTISCILKDVVEDESE